MAARPPHLTRPCDFADDAAQSALLRLLQTLRTGGYAFVPPTPETHANHLKLNPGPARGLRDIFGWSKPFHAERLGDLFAPLHASGVVARQGDLWRSRVRVASVGADLLLHSAFPTDGADAVFLGPDTYRFVRMLRAWAGDEPVFHAVDLGAGAGAGGLALARRSPVRRLVLADINPAALALARVNARFAGVEVELTEAEPAIALADRPDLVIANPPFITDTGRTYSDGGDDLGIAVARDWIHQAMEHLRPGGRLLLYTGAPIVGGRDLLRAALEAAPASALTYEEIDPDIFGEERSDPAYAKVERIAAVGVHFRKRA